MNAKTLPRNSDGKLAEFAWPGGYPIYYLTEDNGVLCPGCANGLNGSCAYTEDQKDNFNEDAQWHIIAADVHWEGDSIFCDHCQREIESAYGPIDEGK